MSFNTSALPPATRKGDGQPTKHILLQKENLVTHDKTWLPARLQPPKLTDTMPYGVYLQQYEQYLHALQYMKGRFLESRRFDVSKRLAVKPTLLPPVTWQHPTAAFVQKGRPLVFGTVQVPPAASSIDSDQEYGNTGLRAPNPTPIDVTVAPPPAKNKPTERQVASRKAAKKARRKARLSTRKLERSTALANAVAEKATAEVKAVSASNKLVAVKQRASKLASKGSAPRKGSKARRLEKRRLARESAVQGTGS
jgi:hypothetical protein